MKLIAADSKLSSRDTPANTPQPANFPRPATAAHPAGLTAIRPMVTA